MHFFMHKSANFLYFVEVLNVICFLTESAQKLHSFSLNISNIFLFYAPERDVQFPLAISLMTAIYV